MDDCLKNFDWQENKNYTSPTNTEYNSTEQHPAIKDTLFGLLIIGMGIAAINERSIKKHLSNSFQSSIIHILYSIV